MPHRTKRPGARKGDSPHNGNGLVDLTRELWQAAVALRGSIEPADYKRYVLPIIFLRFLSLRFERRREELRRLISEPSSEYHTTSKKIAEQILKDPDEYRSAGAFVVPKEASWDYIRDNARDPEIKRVLDDALEVLERTYPDKLRGLLPRIYVGSNMDAEHVAGLINLFSREVFRQDHGGEDLLGRIYEYFIGEFASSEGKRGGEYFTPASIVKTLVAMLEPERGVVFDPCCGSGGMFVQSDIFTRHNHQLSFVGQESKEFTYRLCRMNLFIHGLDGNIALGNSYLDDKHTTVKADFVLANPPFNDGSKGEHGWGADRIAPDDPRLMVDGVLLPLAPRNANTMWILDFLFHLREGGTAGFVMATGELSTSETARLAVRQTLVDKHFVDCVVQLPGQLFANTQIPCALWFLSKNRDGSNSFRSRRDEILFIDGRGLGALIPGSRKQKQLAEEEIARIAAVYREYRRTEIPETVPGFCRVVTIDEVRSHGYVLTPGRYVGATEDDLEDEPFEERFPKLVTQLDEQLREGERLAALLRGQLRLVGHVD
ncbi:MAG TPA: class I SAM-dependent DNA methyltransferase [Gemmatimonadaceae bacterium]|nr:class I SAM-dependent DNA methyltransferase [Gemmatimonadaceae bacterium]